MSARIAPVRPAGPAAPADGRGFYPCPLQKKGNPNPPIHVISIPSRDTHGRHLDSHRQRHRHAVFGRRDRVVRVRSGAADRHRTGGRQCHRHRRAGGGAARGPAQEGHSDRHYRRAGAAHRLRAGRDPADGDRRVGLRGRSGAVVGGVEDVPRTAPGERHEPRVTRDARRRTFRREARQELRRRRLGGRGRRRVDEPRQCAGGGGRRCGDRRGRCGGRLSWLHCQRPAAVHLRRVFCGAGIGSSMDWVSVPGSCPAGARRCSRVSSTS